MQTAILQNKSEAFNQLNSLKDISNFFTPKKCVNKKFTEDSFQVRVFEYYISVPKKFCHLDKNKQNYLIGIIPNYVYNCYDTQKNWREKISGRELIKKYNLKGFHFLTVENQRFKNMQKTNPFLIQFKNAQESMEWHREQVAKEQEQLKTFLLSRKKNTDTGVSEDEIANVNNNHVTTPYQSPKHQERQQELDIKKVFDALYNASNT
ncbi:hypothetical protein [Spiroplasma endosymbiont of Tipula paludosa]|uniref:hypothetical protein n=1 Tax=Spiroplasma endosymbiont of Tipula paludosa TaxID=3066295 RepID=UPI0035C8FF1F